MTYRYRASAFSGVRSFGGVATGGLRICSIFACTNDTLESCGQRFPQYSPNSTANFEALNITAVVPIPQNDENVSAKKTVYFPVTLDASLMPLRPEFYNFEERQILNTVTIFTFNIEKSDAEVYSFALWGRDYAKQESNDTETSTPAPETPDPDSSCVHRIHLLVLLLCTLPLLRL